MNEPVQMLPLIDQLLPELVFSTARSGGPGGQNVNKVETKVEVRFHPASSAILDQEQKNRIQKNLGSKMTTEGWLIVTAQEERSQSRNKEMAVKKLADLLEKGLREAKVRKASKPSAAAKQKRLQTKKRNAEKKANRGPLPDEAI